MEPEFLCSLLADGSVRNIDGEPASLCWRSVGRITLPSGRLIASDSELALSGRVLARRVPPGDHEVRLGIVALSENDERIAFALLHVSGLPLSAIQRWEPALYEDHSDETDGPFYVADSGSGCFCAVESAEAMRAMGKAWKRWWKEVVIAEMGRTMRQWREWAVVSVDDGPPGFAAFTTGLGDGVYASYWGLTDDGEPVALLTDFDIIGSEGETADETRPRRSPE